jgi:hypothetical protein
MRGSAVIAAALLAGCTASKAPPPATSQPAAPPKITQLYLSKPAIGRGEQGLLCYGVENAKTVTLSPPLHELSAALSRCVEVNPASTTTYTLTAQGNAGQTATGTVTLTVGAARVHIVEVRVSELEAAPGDAVSLCYKVESAKAVRIEPGHFQSAQGTACTVVSPRATTTYVLTASGPSGDTDKEQVTVKVK